MNTSRYAGLQPAWGLGIVVVLVGLGVIGVMLWTGDGGRSPGANAPNVAVIPTKTGPTGDAARPTPGADPGPPPARNAQPPAAPKGTSAASKPTAPPVPPGDKPFVDITDAAGVRHRHHKPVLDKKLGTIMPWMASVGAACAAADYDNDGWIDLYVTDSDIGQPNVLYHNNGDGTFTDVAEKAGVARTNDEAVLFSISPEFQADLEKSEGQERVPMPNGLMRQFSAHGIEWPSNPGIAVEEKGKAWRVAAPGRLFIIRKEGDALKVCENRGVSMDAVWGDYDNDGYLDLYITKWGWNVLYHNNGDGTFTDVTEKAGVGDRGNGNAAIWFDYNGDGYLDIYVGNYFRYVNLWNLEDSRQMHEDFETARDGGANVLYRNNGDGTFTNVAKELGVDDTGWTLDVGAADIDNDGDQDLVCANDFGQDRVFRLNADATFTDITDTAIGWDTNKGMNVDFGDYNNDGWLDLYVTNIWTKEYVKEGNQLYRNNGDGTFTDVSFQANVYDGGWAWAGRFWDYDNDGDLDIMVANGYISGDPRHEYFTDLALAVTKPGFDPIDAHNWPMMGNATFAGYEPKRIFRNEGNEVFTEVAAELGLDDRSDGRGLAIFDFDNDGDLDVFMSNQGQDSVFYRNDLGNKSNWLDVELTGTHCNRNAIGTRVTVVSEGQAQIREVNGGNGDHSQCPYRQHFGLGRRTKIDYVELRWPTGYVERFENVKPNQLVKYVENTPQNVLDERKIIKEGEIAALQAQRRKEKERAEAAPKIGEPKEIDWNELGAFKKDYLRYKQAIQEKPDDPKLHHEFGMLLDKQGRKTAALTELERAIELEPEAMPYSNAYRTLIRGYGHVYYDRSIRFFEDLAAAHPKAIMPRLNQSLAYVDKMPYPKLGIVSQGQLSNKSLAVLDSILQDDPTCWTAKFIRGMNHLHWPRKLGHAPMAIKDFTELIELQKKLPPEKQRQYFAFGYIGLGDSYAKNRDEGFEENLRKARETWEQGLREYPNSPDLKQRLELFGQSADQHELIEFIDRLRGLDDPVDTDLSRVWVE